MSSNSAVAFPTKISLAFKEKPRGIFPGSRIIATNPNSPFSTKITPAYMDNANAICAEDRLGGFGENPLSRFPRKITLALKEQSTGPFRGNGLNEFHPNELIPFQTNIAIAFKEDAIAIFFGGRLSGFVTHPPILSPLKIA